ncbi:MAG: hypothetical protein JWQ03_1914 [Variovorax sp.]|nr:hypothetical protein [Variovorax sp.]
MAPSFEIPATQHGPPSGDAFGNLTDLSKMLFQQGRSSVICRACFTINSDSRKFCKGCEGKLPTFYANGGARDTSCGAGVTEPAAMAPPWLSRGSLDRLAPWLGGGVVLVLAALLWNTDRFSPDTQQPAPAMSKAFSLLAARSVTPANEADAVPSPAGGTSSSRQTFALAEVLLPPAADGAVTSRSVMGAATNTTRREAPVDPPLRKARAPLMNPRPVTSGFRRVVASPLASCEGLNFFSKAICMNNRCAQQVAAHRPQCMKVVQQRRLDEARRNPTLLD